MHTNIKRTEFHKSFNARTTNKHNCTQKIKLEEINMEGIWASFPKTDQIKGREKKN